MTKSEKKEIIKNLIAEISKTTDLNEYASKRSQLFHEVIDCGYKDSSLKGVVESADVWCRDFDRNMEAKLQNPNNQTDTGFVALSALGLLTLVDTSLLPD